MTIDREKIKAKLEKLKNKGAGGGGNFTNRFWSPKKDGTESLIRVLQYPHGDDPFVEIWFHYGVGEGKSIVCPLKTSGKPCPACEMTQELWKSGKDADKAQARTIGAKQRFYAAIVDKSDASLTPVLWGFGKTVYGELLQYLMNEDYANYLDPYEGNDFRVSCEKKGGKQYPETTITPRPKPSKLVENSQDYQKISSNVPRIEALFPAMSAVEIKTRLAQWVKAGEGNPETASSETTRGSVDELEDSAPAAGNGIDDVRAAFENALSDENTPF